MIVAVMILRLSLYCTVNSGFMNDRRRYVSNLTNWKREAEKKILWRHKPVVKSASIQTRNKFNENEIFSDRIEEYNLRSIPFSKSG